MPPPRFHYLDPGRVRGEDGQEYDVAEAIDTLPWVSQTCPSMPHQYAPLSSSSDRAWFALEAMVRSDNPASYRAYFRGYQSANRYWDAPDGLRYWRTRFELNRCEPDSVEPLRRVDEGAKPIKDWDGPPFAPNRSGLYVELKSGRWWPTEKAIAAGYLPCKACQHRPGQPAPAGP